MQIQELQESEARQAKLQEESRETKKQKNKFACDYLVIQRRKRRQKLMEMAKDEHLINEKLSDLR